MREIRCVKTGCATALRKTRAAPSRSLIKSHVRTSACVSLAAVLFSRRTGGRRASASPMSPQQLHKAEQLKTTCSYIVRCCVTDSTRKPHHLADPKDGKSYFCVPVWRPELIILRTTHAFGSKRAPIPKGAAPALTHEGSGVCVSVRLQRRWPAARRLRFPDVTTATERRRAARSLPPSAIRQEVTQPRAANRWFLTKMCARGSDTTASTKELNRSLIKHKCILVLLILKHVAPNCFKAISKTLL